MNRKLPVLILTGALACAVFSPALAAGVTPAATPIAPRSAAEEVPALLHSVLYYGTVQEILREEDGTPVQLSRESEAFGD